MRPIKGLRVNVPEIPVEESVVLDADKTALIIVDMQNDFVKPGGKLRVPAAEATIEPIKKLLEKARKHQVMTIFTQDTHYLDDPEFKIWGEHVVKGTWGWEIIDELKPVKGEIVVEKTRYDGFYGTPIDDLLRVHGIQNVIVVGTVANICVLHTAASAALRWYKVYMPLNAISALNDFDYYVALRQVSFLYRGVLVEKAEAIEFRGTGKWRRA
ncbi:isochorismatase family protein [Pyrofollis japonicus]|uniref:cysteine hydrolase family protein n=1 Tax=Pyrofollis japonicus TaxID=3060460 RepID=UPI00295B7542|nr:isochorismatase family cysteine hydrolase [Pyrofollis japonicus]BEP18279.1 isochorismatase family protein [Pyrofollis japonicus]